MKGIVVTLYRADDSDAFVEFSATVTDATGHYQFQELADGDYHLAVAMPQTCFASPANVGNNDAVDSDLDSDTGHTATVAVDRNQRTIYQDVGISSVVVPSFYAHKTATQIYLPMIVGDAGE